MIKEKEGNQVEVLAMLDSRSNSSFISKNVTKKLGFSDPKVHLAMNLAGGQKKSEESQLINITVVSISEGAVQLKQCISKKLYLSGGTVDLLIRTHPTDAFVDIHVIFGSVRESIAKRYCLVSVRHGSIY